MIYSVDDVLHWSNNQAIISPKDCKSLGVSFNAEKQEKAYSISLCPEQKEIHGYSAQELAEMRNEFGAGTKIVDCLTGQRFTL